MCCTAGSPSQGPAEVGDSSHTLGMKGPETGPSDPGDRVFVGRGAAPPPLQMRCVGSQTDSGHLLQPWRTGHTGEDFGTGTCSHQAPGSYRTAQNTALEQARVPNPTEGIKFQCFRPFIPLNLFLQPIQTTPRSGYQLHSISA